MAALAMAGVREKGLVLMVVVVVKRKAARATEVPRCWRSRPAREMEEEEEEMGVCVGTAGRRRGDDGDGVDEESVADMRIRRGEEKKKEEARRGRRKRREIDNDELLSIIYACCCLPCFCLLWDGICRSQSVCRRSSNQSQF